jgi:D-alanyl-D-alanine carboxypeptidase (penicillin-binding protein 5/6)
MQTFETKHPFLAACGTLLLVMAAFVSGVGAVSVLNAIKITQVAAVAEALETPIAVDPASLTAKAAIVYDPMTQRVLYEKNAYESLPLASLTKLVTATAILNHTSSNPTIVITKDMLVQNGAEADANFSPGDKVTLHDLLKIGLIASSNDAIQAAAKVLGPNYTQVLEATVFNLGIKDMQFNNGTGLDINETTAGAYGSAYDMAVITANFAAHHPEYFDLTQKPDVTISAGWGGTISAHATMLPLQDMPGFVGAKTGYTTMAGGNVVAIYDVEVGHPLVVVILGSTQAGRFTDAEALIQAARNAEKNHI